MGGAVFGAEVIEVGVRDESAIGGLPGFDVDTGYGEGVRWLGEA